ncbi:hypothetical protein [Paraburkholderia sp. PGU19]|uniref:hypothetical protein n=1 Tax=Paraburkholderia sp. PGU19 TaxID=2735434 RepID=UPI0015DB27D8|nr:hypothetical protein [Paraburkholderia sp. PGU19]
MRDTKLEKLRQQLREMRKHATGRRAPELEALARQVGRVKDNRGKEPTWVREKDPELSPPLSIPHHSQDMKAGTVRSIIDQLLDDLDTWESYLQDDENDED